MWERGVVTANEFSWMTLFQLSCSVIIEQQIAKEGGKLDPRTVLRVWEKDKAIYPKYYLSTQMNMVHCKWL